MSHCFRNLVLLAILCVAVQSLSISRDAHNKFNHHMLRIHKSAFNFMHHQQEVNGFEFVTQMETIISDIQGSIDT